MTKHDYASTLAILLDLSQQRVPHLMKLPEETLVKIYDGILKNAKAYNHQEDYLRESKMEILRLNAALQSKSTAS